MKNPWISDMRRFIIFLIRKKLKLKKYQDFTFVGQKSDAVYYFTESNIMKKWRGHTTLSGVSVNWLLDKDCKIERVEMGGDTQNGV